MKQKIKYLAFVFLIILPTLSYLIIIIPEQALSDEKINLKARFWNYDSLCNFKDSPNEPRKYKIKDGSSFTTSGCKDIDKKMSHPQAIRVTIENEGKADIEVPIAALNNFILKTNDNKSILPIALRAPDRGEKVLEGGISSQFNFRDKTEEYISLSSQNAYFRGFTTEIIGTWILVLSHAEVVDLILLFPNASCGDTVIFGSTGQVKIDCQ